MTWTCTVAPHVQVTLENEAVEALERSDSVEESGRLSSSLASVDDEVVEHLKAVGARRSLYQAKLEEMCDDERHPYAPEIEKLEALKEPPIDFFSQVNPDCFNVHGLPLSRPRWHPPRGNDARRRPTCPVGPGFWFTHLSPSPPMTMWMKRWSKCEDHLNLGLRWQSHRWKLVQKCRWVNSSYKRGLRQLNLPYLLSGVVPIAALIIAGLWQINALPFWKALGGKPRSPKNLQRNEARRNWKMKIQLWKN